MSELDLSCGSVLGSGFATFHNCLADSSGDFLSMKYTMPSLELTAISRRAPVCCACLILHT